MGLPGAGKTFLANKLVPMINAIWLNADTARREANDWDFSKEGRKRQAKRMNDLALKALKRLWLWNTPHFSDKHLALLREKGIRVWDGRFKKSKNYSLPHFE